MNKKTLIDRMSKKLENGEGAIFVGAGISASSTRIDWYNLLLPLTSDLNIQLEKKDDLPLIAQYIVNNYSGNRGPLLHEICKAFNKSFPLNNYHKYLATTKVSTIWTTNYDMLLENAFSDFNVSVKTDDDSITRNICESDIEIIKMHGCIQKSKYEDIVITQEDYDDFLIRRPAVAQRLSEDLMNKSFLFIGYSLRDPDIKNVMLSARRLIKNHTREHYFILMDECKSEEERKRQDLWCNDLKRLGVSTLLIHKYDELEKILAEISKKSRGKTVFVTGSHEETSPASGELGRLLARDSDVVLLSGQSAGVGSNVIAAFTEECINKKMDIMNRIRVFPNPYATNEKYSNDPKLIPELKRCRAKLLNATQLLIAFPGGIGTVAEIETAIKQNCYLLPVITKDDDWKNPGIQAILTNEDNKKVLKEKDKDYYDKLYDDKDNPYNTGTNITMIDVKKCVARLLDSSMDITDGEIAQGKNTHILIKSTDKQIECSKNSKTLINVLLGANNADEYKIELDKIRRINSIESAFYRPDIITDLSIAKRTLKECLWYKVLKETPFVAATLPIYTVQPKENKIDDEELLDIILEQMENGVGMMTIHPTATREIFELAKERMVPITSRGGGMVLKDLIANNFKGKNVYMRILPPIIEAAKKNGVVLSIGATFRSGNIFDSRDKAQLAELDEQRKIADKISESGVGVILESPGHAQPKDILKIASILNQTEYPIMPLGPIPTETSIGMDHISSAIGATIMGLHGCANIISTVTREEHTGGIPSIDSTIEAIQTAKIAAHIIDMHRLNDVEEDKKIAEDRAKNHTCIYGKKSMYCDRCSQLCPLNIQ